MKKKILIGWREYIDLPEWGVRKLKAKIDTGARTSALHVENIKELNSGKIRFDVILHREHRDRTVRVVAQPIKKAAVKSSIGVKTSRWFVETLLRIGPVEQRIKITLVNRSEMNHRMLLGRTALEGAFLIDINRSYLLGE
ncbi:MAG: ATP-dependent zinc protease [Candidatus Omnitrophica bacterium]|nr:ATP-dependent zinc protease [Candidatus Omnitrophota bacterium]